MARRKKRRKKRTSGTGIKRVKKGRTWYMIHSRKVATPGKNHCYIIRRKGGGRVALCNKGTAAKPKMRFVGKLV